MQTSKGKRAEEVFYKATVIYLKSVTCFGCQALTKPPWLKKTLWKTVGGEPEQQQQQYQSMPSVSLRPMSVPCIMQVENARLFKG